MNLGESFSLALAAIRANKMRSALTLLGIIIGVMTIIAMQSLITGMRNSVLDQASVLSSNVFQIQKFPSVWFTWNLSIAFANHCLHPLCSYGNYLTKICAWRLQLDRRLSVIFSVGTGCGGRKKNRYHCWTQWSRKDNLCP